MQGPAWVSLIQRIPEKHHDKLVAVTTAGAEIMVQRFLRLTDEYLVFRGRPMGSTEQGRIIILPLDQLNYLAFHKIIAEQEVFAMFPGSGTMAATALEATAAVEIPARAETDGQELPAPAAVNEPAVKAESPWSAQETPKKPEPAPAAAPAALEHTKAGPPSKTILLARLRARLAKDSAS